MIPGTKFLSCLMIAWGFRSGERRKATYEISRFQLWPAVSVPYSSKINIPRKVLRLELAAIMFVFVDGCRPRTCGPSITSELTHAATWNRRTTLGLWSPDGRKPQPTGRLNTNDAFSVVLATDQSRNTLWIIFVFIGLHCTTFVGLLFGNEHWTQAAKCPFNSIDKIPNHRF